MRGPFYRAVMLVAAVAVTIYVAACGYLYVFQRSYVFVPGGVFESPEQPGLDHVEVITIAAADGTQLRIVTTAVDSIAPGASVWLCLPPERCRALVG